MNSIYVFSLVMGGGMFAINKNALPIDPNRRSG